MCVQVRAKGVCVCTGQEREEVRMVTVTMPAVRGEEKGRVKRAESSSKGIRQGRQAAAGWWQVAGKKGRVGQACPASPAGRESRRERER